MGMIFTNIGANTRAISKMQQEKTLQEQLTITQEILATLLAQQELLMPASEDDVDIENNSDAMI